MGLQDLQLDLKNEYSSYSECMGITGDDADELFSALLEQQGSIEAIIVDKPRVFYTCEKIPFRSI